jgi:hypothetical protein
MADSSGSGHAREGGLEMIEGGMFADAGPKKQFSELVFSELVSKVAEHGGPRQYLLHALPDVGTKNKFANYLWLAWGAREE